ncbi:MAG TPA: HEAT repeat domain-containing protein [Gemmataceae bacterium]|nr:HEAT repeat domain-containing protein [Gemmataceae bacterium]
MRKLAATASLALLLLGCENSFREEAVWEGVSTSGWVEQLQDDDVEKRRKAAEVLGELGPTEADLTVRPLADALKDTDAHVRLMALKSLEKLAPKASKVQPAVGRAMNDKNKIIARQAMTTYKAIEMAKPSALNNN